MARINLWVCDHCKQLNSPSLLMAHCYFVCEHCNQENYRNETVDLWEQPKPQDMGITNDNLIALMQSPKIENKLIAFEMIRNTDVVAAWSLSKDIAKVKAQELAYESFMSWQDVWERSEQLGLLSHVFPHLTFEVFGGIMNDYRDKYDRLIQMYQRVLSQFDPNTKEGYVDFTSFYRTIFRNETKSPTP